jgi:hypothetical protein
MHLSSEPGIPFLGTLPHGNSLRYVQRNVMTAMLGYRKPQRRAALTNKSDQKTEFLLPLKAMFPEYCKKKEKKREQKGRKEGKKENSMDSKIIFLGKRSTIEPYPHHTSVI